MQVYLAIASPPVRYPNVYGVDMPTRKEFVANGLSVEEVRAVLGADGLVYQELGEMIDVAKGLNPNIETFDSACFDGKYVTDDIDAGYLEALENSGRTANRNRAGQKTTLVAQ